ncbi:hypothetical protein RMCBS344292_00319 [Rhizopus microsporus]|nr:hypothetical protein RMCBS344292_00319 [Rhizopus microsporus]
MSIGEFLAQLHSSLEKQPQVIVSGNDSADLDSIISSLLFAYFSNLRDKTKTYVPVDLIINNWSAWNKCQVKAVWS